MKYSCNFLITWIFCVPSIVIIISPVNKSNLILSALPFIFESKNFIPFDTKVDLHYSEFSEVDKNHAMYIKNVNCVLIEHETSSHLLALELRDSGQLKEIIKAGLDNY